MMPTASPPRPRTAASAAAGDDADFTRRPWRPDGAAAAEYCRLEASGSRRQEAEFVLVEASAQLDRDQDQGLS